MNDFHQTGPRLINPYDGDPLLRVFLRRRLPAPILAEIEPDLRRFGDRVIGEIQGWGDEAEAHPPMHVPYDAWGRRIDDIVVSDGWRALDRASAEEGLVAIGYERRHAAFSRIHQMAKLYLFHPSSATYSCPLAMGDGAARFLEVHGDHATRYAFDHLTSRDPSRFWTSGQWMTERTGGSDVSQTSTVARQEDGSFRLYGTKWFTSATTSQMALALARIDGAPTGGRGLSVFLVELRDESGALRGIRVNRLKDKLGTRALPTAELTLEGTPATLVGGAGDGVRKISALFNVTRVYNAVAAIGGMRRALALADDYSRRRMAFGRRLADQPLHRDTLAGLEARCRASFLLTFRVVELLGKEECGTASESELAILRLLTPVAKLYTAKQAVIVASEVCEAFGGAGYVEDTGIPRLLRDAQVLPIWEGTTNVLSLDMWRAIERTGAFEPWIADVRARLRAVNDERLHGTLSQVRAMAEDLGREVASARDTETREANARRLAFAIARVTAALELIEHTCDVK
ncbi:MAG TPA: acyl-CoA dehydrogenase family protein [Gemmatimonadaceae bacterium]|jgi:alkylation response protein AidB-like acyl-CoA dehydrogenase|nr:acyl-CoA dehydrogenase family protein [Gemmatimonadaceae bacterium]